LHSALARLLAHITGNFMLLSEDARSPVKAIDLGLAIPFEREDLPLTHLGLEGKWEYSRPPVPAALGCHSLTTFCA